MDPFVQSGLTVLAVVAVMTPLAFWLMPKADLLGSQISDWMEDRKARRRNS